MTDGSIKQQFRKRAWAAVAEMSPDRRRTASSDLVDHLSDWLKRWRGEHDLAASIGFFVPMGSEPDILPLLEQCWRADWSVALPRVHDAAVPGDIGMSFRAVAGFSDLQRGNLGVMEPAESAVEVMPAVAVIPGVAFGRDGRRLGRGGGFYDRWLGARRASGRGVMTVGVAFESQIFDDLPVEAHDRAMDWLAMPQAVFDCALAGGS